MEGIQEIEMLQSSNDKSDLYGSLSHSLLMDSSDGTKRRRFWGYVEYVSFNY